MAQKGCALQFSYDDKDGNIDDDETSPLCVMLVTIIVIYLTVF